MFGVAMRWRVAAVVALSILGRSHCRVSFARLTALARAGIPHGCAEDSGVEMTEVPRIIHQAVHKPSIANS